jgi:hypothetical protein
LKKRSVKTNHPDEEFEEDGKPIFKDETFFVKPDTIIKEQTKKGRSL